MLAAANPGAILVANQIVSADKAARLLRLNERLPVVAAVDSAEGARFLAAAAAAAGRTLPWH